MMHFVVVFATILPSLASAEWPHPWPAEWLQSQSQPQIPFDLPQIPLVTVQAGASGSESACTLSNLSAFETTKGRHISAFSTSPLDHLEHPKISPLNTTTGEQWEFDGVSSDGLSSFVLGFYRDPNYAILGSGNFRLSVEMAFADRPRFYEVYYPSRSVVESCDGLGTRGLWVDEKEGYSFSFAVDPAMQRAVVHLDSQSVKGTIVLRSRAKPLLADGSVWPAENGSTLAVPFYHWAEPIPAGTVEVDVTAKGNEIKWEGMGGHERFWSSFSWFTCLTGLNAVRAMLGPFVLTYFGYTSNMDRNLTSQSVVLFKDGVPVFRSTLGEPSPSNAADYAIVTKSYGGTVTGTLKDKVTGYQLELISPSSMQHYTFFVVHKNLGFEYILGEGVGGSGFSGMSRGGHIGLGQHEGVALTEALTFPKNSPLFKSNYVA